MHALSQGGLFARIPDLQQALGLDEAQLGLALLGQPLGAIAAFLVAGRLVERLGTRIVILPSIPLMAVFLTLAALAPNALLLAAGLAAMGAVFALANVAINVEADRVEAAIGRRIFNTCHGVWSASLLATTLIAHRNAWRRRAACAAFRHHRRAGGDRDGVRRLADDAGSGATACQGRHGAPLRTALDHDAAAARLCLRLGAARGRAEELVGDLHARQLRRARMGAYADAAGLPRHPVDRQAARRPRRSRASGRCGWPAPWG